MADLFNEGYFWCTKGRFVFSVNIMKPQGRLIALRHRCIPGIDGVCFSGNKSPVDGTYILLFQQWHNQLKKATVSPSHVLCTNQWPSKFLQCVNSIPVLVNIVVIVVGNHIWIVQLKPVEGPEIRAAVPNACCYRLWRRDCPCPLKNEFQQGTALKPCLCSLMIAGMIRPGLANNQRQNQVCITRDG